MCRDADRTGGTMNEIIADLFGMSSQSFDGGVGIDFSTIIWEALG